MKVVGGEGARGREVSVELDADYGQIVIAPSTPMADGVDVTILSFIAPRLQSEWAIGSDVMGNLFSAGLIGMARQGLLRPGERVLFLHTGGLPSLSTKPAVQDQPNNFSNILRGAPQNGH